MHYYKSVQLKSKIPPYVGNDTGRFLNIHSSMLDNEFKLCDHVIVRNIGGHSYGSSIVICQLEEKNYILCGDECYVKACFDRQLPTGVSTRPEVSQHFLREYGGGNNIPLLFHEPSILQEQIGYETLIAFDIHQVSCPFRP